jgi:hypothetical protein
MAAQMLGLGDVRLPTESAYKDSGLQDYFVSGGRNVDRRGELMTREIYRMIKAA